MLTLVLLLLLLIPLYFYCKKPPGLPPGIWGLPVVGKLPDPSLDITTQVNKLRSTFGDIILWRMGCTLNVFLCDYHVIKKALARPEFADRPEYFTYTVFAEGNRGGIFSGNGVPWRQGRRSTLRHLRDLGMGRTILEETMQSEAQCLVQDLRRATGKAQPLPLSVGLAVHNILCKVLAGKRYEMDDPKGLELVHRVQASNESLQGPVFFFNIFPALLTIAPPFLKKWLGYYELQDNVAKVMEIMTEIVDDHKATLDPSQPRDLVDHLLIEQEKDAMEGNESLSLQSSLGELLLAGIETTTSMLFWSILYFMQYPKVQQKVQEEIDSVLPKGSLLYYHERNKLPYLEATISEIHRIVTLAPLAAAHKTTQDTQLEGYTLPKGTVVVPVIECCHKDPKLWDNPDQFDPERFLNPDGTFNSRKEGIVPFGSGRRECVGESLAKVEVFVLLVALLQNFTFTKPPGEVVNTKRNPTVIIINAPNPYNVIISERQ